MSGQNGPSDEKIGRMELINRGIRNLAMASDTYSDMSVDDYGVIVQAGLENQRECHLASQHQPSDNFEQVYTTNINRMKKILAENGAPSGELQDDYLASQGTPEKSHEAILIVKSKANPELLQFAEDFILRHYANTDEELDRRIAKDN